jgi:hypothetical protein
MATSPVIKAAIGGIVVIGLYMGTQQLNLQIDKLAELPVGVNNVAEASTPVAEASLKTLHPLMLESKTKKALLDADTVASSPESNEALNQAFVDEEALKQITAIKEKESLQAREASESAAQVPKVINLKPKSNLTEVANLLRVTGVIGAKTILINNKATELDSVAKTIYFYSAPKNSYINPILVATSKGYGLKDPDTGIIVLLKAEGLSLAPSSR